MNRIQQSNTQTIKQFPILLLAAAVFGASAASAAYRVADADVVVADSISGLVDRSDGNWTRLAVRDLTNAIARTTGRCPKVYAESKAPADLKAAIYVGDTKAGKAYLDEKMRALDFRLVTKGNSTFVISRTPTATSYGVGEYLRRVCDYWFVTVKGDDPVVRNPDLVAAEMDVAPKPTMYYRFLEHGMYDYGRYPTTKFLWEEWNRHARLVSCGRDIEPCEQISLACGKDCHTSFCFCDPKKYFKDHPEYFSMVSGNRRQFEPFGQLCYSNPQVKEIVYNSFVEFIEKDRKGRKPGDWPTIYDFSQEDNTSFICKCPDCRKIIEKYTTAADPKSADAPSKGGDCGLVLSFVNDIARRLAPKYPDVTIRMFAYVSTENPPKDLKPEPNVLIWLCDLYSQCSHEYPLEHPFNAKAGRGKLIADWAKLARRVELWDYMLYWRNFPEVNVDAIAADAKFFGKIGLDRYFMESEYSNQPFFELNSFVLGELMYDPSQPLEPLVKKYCRVYGKGADEMERAIAFIRAEMLAHPPKSMADWHSRVLTWHTPEILSKFRALCEQAYAKESEGAARGRIAKALAATALRQMAVYRWLEGKDAEFAEACEAYRRYGKEDMRWTVMEEKGRRGQIAAVDTEIERQKIWFDDLPAELKAVPKSAIRCLNSRYFNYDGHGKFITDPLAFGKRALYDPHSNRFVPCGVYDQSTKASHGMAFKLPDGDLPTDRYEWRKVGVAQIGPNSLVWLPGSWDMSVILKDFYVFCDGAEKDLNWYEFWVSMKFEGQAFNSREPKDRKNAIVFDRWVMRRVDPPKSGK